MNKTFTVYAAAALSGVVLIGILGAAHLNKPEPVDALGCAQDVQGKTVIVLDTSDEVATQTRDEIVERVKNTVEHKIRDGDLVSVFTVNDLSKKNLVPAFAYCKPRRTGNELKESTRMLERHYVTKFEKPLQAAVQAPIKGSKESPIAQSLIDLSLLDYMRSNGATHLVIFSDLMEYTDRFSLYRCSGGAQVIKTFKESRGATVARPTFHNVSVELNIIPRSDVSAGVGRCRDTFWAWFFGYDEGPDARLVPSNLPG
ncbi:hypothetical protein BVER_05822c [Candidatus Burkholderia verschuerenii]|uniref:VWA domain-containing protein n=1 Tax=Candidatus Burkholderia verschuerenii TaxID=242163 RepID=A0A0L0M5A9_9BURK|nr:hypothetical protein [Candidatus Burkholderia verschuerenii]KND57465.1 hypothetical protein BVER_05822c [Candidatus Burkholderia verschuerenii]